MEITSRHNALPLIPCVIRVTLGHAGSNAWRSVHSYTSHKVCDESMHCPYSDLRLSLHQPNIDPLRYIFVGCKSKLYVAYPQDAIFKTSAHNTNSTITAMLLHLSNVVSTYLFFTYF